MVADGAKMLFFRNEGDAEFLKLEIEQKREQENLPDRELMTDGHGAAPAGGGLGGSTYERPDHHQLEEDKFAAEAAEELKRRALKNDFESLIIVAPPKTLGELRNIITRKWKSAWRRSREGPDGPYRRGDREDPALAVSAS
jgi:protein required for attachment to host cells